MTRAPMDEDSDSEDSISEKRSRLRGLSFFNRTGNRLGRRSSSDSKSSSSSVAGNDERPTATQPTWKVKSKTKSARAESGRPKSQKSTSAMIKKRIGGVVSNLKQRVSKRTSTEGEEEEEEDSEDDSCVTAVEKSTNFEAIHTVRSSSDEEVFRPWRLEKANVQKPKSLHKTGKEKKEDSFRVAPRPPPAPSELSSFLKYEYCVLYRMSKIAAPKVDKPALKSPPNAEPNAYEGTISELEIKTTMKTWIWRRTGFKHFDIIRHMKVESVTDRHRYRYKLESFMERRCVRWMKIPYHGNEEDESGGGNITVLGPWDLPVGPTNGTLWEEETILMPVPGTTILRLCENCQGKGWIRCWKCDQAGNYLCYWCDGKGGFYDGEGHWKYCWTCKGIGIVYCTICEGYTKLVCAYCEGYFEVKFFIQLQVEFFIKVHKYYIEESKTDVPTQKEKKWTGCRSGSGERVLEAEEDRLSPLSTFNVAELNEISHGAISRHDNYYTGLRIHRQRHFVDVIPVFEIEASWKNTNFVFWIYGQKGQRKVYFPNADAFLPVRKVCCVL